MTDREIRLLRGKGLSYRAIAKESGLSHETVRKIVLAVESPNPLPDMRRKHTPDVIRRRRRDIGGLFERNWTIDQIAKRIGVDKVTVYSDLKKSGYDIKEKK